MTTSGKIVSITDLAAVVAQWKKQGDTVVHCHGVFDLLHLGHIRYFEQARSRGGRLVVTVTPDRFVNKGNHRPVFSDAVRAETIASMFVVDYVAVNEWADAAETIRLLRPSVYCKGGEFRNSEDVSPGLRAEMEAASEAETRVEFTDDNLFSSSNLINSHIQQFPSETEDWLADFRSRQTTEDILRYLERIRDLRVLVVGEAIIDEYVFCDGLGKSNKDPVLAFLYQSTERYGGGSIAVANHLAGLCNEVGLVTCLGDVDRSEDFVSDALLPEVKHRYATWHGAPTIRKRRYVDRHTNARMFELYTMADDVMPAVDERQALEILQEEVGAYDVVVVADYGHGFLTPKAVTEICGSTNFLSVNTQCNAGNRGFNTISKYPQADYVCLAMHEVALETRMRHSDWRDLVVEVTQKIDCPKFTVTHGRHGTLHYTVGDDFVEAPALAVSVRDRVGAGDAVFAVTSVLVAQDAPWDVVGLIGNLAGSQMVAELGNRTTITRQSITQGITSLMK